MTREMKDSGIPWIGEIPMNWQIIQFKRVHEGTNVGEGIDKSFWSDNVNDKVFYTAGLFPITTTFSNFPSWKYTKDNDVLLSRNGTPYVYLPNAGSLYTDHIIRVSIRSVYDRRFIKYVVSQSISNEIVDTVSIATWSASLWNEQMIPMPIFSEQQAIADFLDKKCSEIDELVVLQEKMIEELKSYKQSVITEAVTKGLDPNVPMKDSGIDWIGEIPEGWNLSRVGLFYFVTKLAGFEYTDSMVNNIVETGAVPIVRAQNVRMFHFNKEIITEFIDGETSAKLNRCSLSTHCLLMTFIGAGIGDVCLFDENKRYHLAPNVAKIEILPKYSHEINDKYIMYYLGSNAGKGEIDKISKASAQASLSMSTIRRMAILLPSFEDQQAIATFLDQKCSEIDSLIKIKQDKIEALKEYKKSIIYEYVTGKKEVV